MADYEITDANFLPDLPDEMSMMSNWFFKGKLSDPMRLSIKVIMTLIFGWNYPKTRLKKKNTFHKHIKRYSYDSENGVLYKKVKCSDGIGKHEFIYTFGIV